MANIGDLLGLAIKSREAIAKQASTVASNAATAVKAVQVNSEAQKIKASYQPGEFIKPQDVQVLIKAGTPVVNQTYQTPVYQGTSISKSAPIPMPVKIASATASAITGKNIKTEDFAGALKTAQGVGLAAIEGVKTARERHNVALAQYKKTRYVQDAARFGGANFSYVQQKALFDKLTPEEKDGLYFQAISPTDEGRKYGELQKQALNLQLADPAGVGASQYFPSSQVRKYVNSAGAEREQVLKEMLLDIPGAAVKGFLSGRSFGISSVLDGGQTGRQAVRFDENEGLQKAASAVQQGIGVVAGFAGGFKTYGYVAQKVGAALNKVPGKMGQAISAHPIFSAYVLQNLGEEIVDGTIRKTTGQEYGPRDFALGMLMGFAFQGGHDWLKNVGIDKPTEAILKVNQALAEAEQAKGAKLDRTEVEKVMYDTPIGNGMTFGNAFDRAKLAYKTGMAGSPFGGKMTSLKSSGITPSVTDMGVTIPDRLPELDNTRFKGVDLDYQRNTEKSVNMGKKFAQDIEPAGRYMNLGDVKYAQGLPNMEVGKIKFENPLVVDWKTSGHGGWKTDLSAKYGNKTGADLSKAIAEDGYDGIITVDKGEPQEVVSLKDLVVKADPLLTEALKYKTPEEFVKAREYRGAYIEDFEPNKVEDQFGRELTREDIEEELQKIWREEGSDQYAEIKLAEEGEILDDYGNTYTTLEDWRSRFDDDKAELKSLLDDLNNLPDPEKAAIDDWLKDNEKWLGDKYDDVVDAIYNNQTTGGTAWKALLTADEEEARGLLDAMEVAAQRHGSTKYDEVSKRGLSDDAVAEIRREFNQDLDRGGLQPKTEEELKVIWYKANKKALEPETSLDSASPKRLYKSPEGDEADLYGFTSKRRNSQNIAGRQKSVNKTGGAELPDAGRLSEEAAMRAEMKDNRLKPLVDRAKQLELSEEDFVKQFDDTLSGQNLTRKDTAQNVLKELDKMGLSPKEFYNKYIGLPKEIDNELMRLGAKAEAEGWSQDKLKKEHDLLSGEAERVAAANKMELEVGKPMPPDFLDELPTKKALTMEDVDWYNLSAEELDALPDHLKREIEAKWDEAYREDIKQDMEGVADNDLPDGWKDQARKVVTDFKAMVEGKNRFFLLGNKKYKGVYKGGEIQLSAGKGFKETINKLFLSGDMDTFTKNLNILAQHYKGTLFGDQVKRVLENWKTGLLDDPRIYTEYLEPELFKAIDEKAVVDPRKRLLADIGRLGREGLWADKAWGEYLKEFAHKAANPKILKQFGDFGKRLSSMIDEADMKTSMAAGRHVRLMGDAMTKMTGDELQALVKLSEGDLRPQDVKNQRVLAAFETWDKIRGEIATRAKEAGLKIKTSKGEEIDFVPRKNYFPHFLQEDKLRDVLAQKNGIEVLTQRIAELNNIDQAEAFALVRRFINAKKKGKYGNLERARESLSSLVKLPDYAYEKDPRKVLMSYIVGANKRLADAEIFGPNAERAKVMIYKYFKEGGNSTTLQKVFDRMAGRELFDPTVTKLSQWVRSYNTVTKLGLSAVTNLGDIIKPFIRTDFWPAFKAVLQSFSAEGKAFAADTGVVQENVKKMLAEMGETKFSDKFMKYTGFEATETQLRRIGSLAGRNYAEILFSKLKKNPDNLFAIRRLEQLNIDTKAALERGNLTEEDLLMAGYKTVADMQPISRQDAPYYWQDPAVKIATQFKSFAMKQGVFLKDFVFDEARKGNLKPLITFVVGGLAVGEVVGDLKAAVRLRERQGDVFGRILDDLMTIGGLGLATDFFSNMFYDQTGYGFLKFVVGPTATDLANGTSAVFSDVRRLVEKGPESFAALGQKSEAGKAQSRVGKELVQKVPVVGQIIRGKVFPPRQTYKARTAEENEDIYAELNQKPTAGKKYNIP